MIDWIVGIFLGFMLGWVNFILLRRQVASGSRSRGTMILGSWARYLLLGGVIYFVYRKESVSFPGFILGLVSFYLFMAVWAWRGARS